MLLRFAPYGFTDEQRCLTPLLTLRFAPYGFTDEQRCLTPLLT